VINRENQRRIAGKTITVKSRYDGTITVYSNGSEIANWNVGRGNEQEVCESYYRALDLLEALQMELGQ
jgi:hypothetical protein